MTPTVCAAQCEWPMQMGAASLLLRDTDWAATSLGALAQWGERLRCSVEHLLFLPMPALLLCGAERLVLYNEACAALLGDLHPGLFGKPLGSGWPALEECCAAALAQAEAGSAACAAARVMTLMRAHCAEQRCLDLHCAPVYDGAGQPVAVQVLIDDQTPRRRVERSLRRDADQLAALFSQAQVGLSELSLEGSFLRVNDELSRMLARPAPALLGLGIADVTHPDDLAHSLAKVGMLIETGVPVSIEKRYLRPDGGEVWANSRVSRLDPVQPGAPYTLLAVTVDLTERTLARQALADSEARFRALADAAPAFIWQFDAHGELTYHNPRCEALYASLDIMPQQWPAVLHHADAQWFLSGLAQAQSARQPFHARYRVRGGHGAVRWFESSIAPWFSAPGTYAGQVGISIDISDLVETQHALTVANERLNLAVQGSGDGVWDWDLANDEITVSERMKQIAGVVGVANDKRLDLWRQMIHPDDWPATRAAMRDALSGATPGFSAEYRIRCGDGNWKWILARAIVVARDAQGQALRVTGLATDVSAGRQSQEIVWRHANFDALTGLPNRRLFRSRLEHEVKMAQRTGALLALLFIDLDHFKQANDLLGHAAGDQLLVQAARRIEGCVRSSDTVARLGGDEFTAILMPLEDTHDAENLAAKINHALAQPFMLGAEVVHLSASIGITICPNDGADPDKLIRNADQAMYVAKHGGRDQFNYFTPAMQNQAQSRLHLIADLRLAVASGELEMYFQPVVALGSGRLVKAEALLRWHHPRLGLLAPADFIPYAEESGLISDIGDWAFQQAARYSRKWRRWLGTEFQVSVNSSAVQFMARPEGSNWPAYLAELDLDGHGMTVEITEQVLLNASPRVSHQLRQYHDAGMQVAIDDFGSGYCSLTHLKKYDIDYLKIDPAFIHGLADSEGDRAIVRSVTAMAHELGLQVIAEGIETAQQTGLLIAAGCDFGQGYHFGRPLPAAQFEHVFQLGAVAGRE